MSRPRILKSKHPLTERELRVFEERLGEPIPEPYRRFLLEHNGGKPDRKIFRFVDEIGELRGDIISYFLAVNEGYPEDIESTLERRRKRIPPDLFPIASTVCGDQVVIGSRGPRAGKVYYWDHELEAMPGEPMTYDNVFLIADSFDAFLENLEAEPEEEPLPPPVILGGSTLSEDNLRSFEQRIGEAVPEPYRAFLLQHNGAVPERTVVYFQGWYGMRRGAVVTGFLGVGIGGPHDLGQVLEKRRKRIPADLFPIARDGTGSLIVIGSQGTRAGKLYFWDAWGTHSDQPPDKADLFFICESFQELLEVWLRPPKDD